MIRIAQLNIFNSNVRELLSQRCQLQARMDYYLHVTHDDQHYETCCSRMQSLNNRISNHYNKNNKENS